MRKHRAAHRGYERPLPDCDVSENGAVGAEKHPAANLRREASERRGSSDECGGAGDGGRAGDGRARQGAVRSRHLWVAITSLLPRPAKSHPL